MTTSKWHGGRVVTFCLFHMQYTGSVWSTCLQKTPTEHTTKAVVPKIKKNLQELRHYRVPTVYATWCMEGIKLTIFTFLFLPILCSFSFTASIRFHLQLAVRSIHATVLDISNTEDFGKFYECYEEARVVPALVFCWINLCFRSSVGSVTSHSHKASNFMTHLLGCWGSTCCYSLFWNRQLFLVGDQLLKPTWAYHSACFPPLLNYKYSVTP